MISKGLARNKFLSCARDGNYYYHSRKDLEDENAMKIKAIQDYYERNCEKHGNGKVMATVSYWVTPKWLDHDISLRTNFR